MAFKRSLGVSALVLALPLVFGSTLQQRNSCNFLKPIVNDLLDNLFNRECGEAAHGALRLVFHDAIGISPTLGGGGADGSIIVFNATELTFPSNAGIEDVLEDIEPFVLKYQKVLSPGDFIQLAGALSLSVCPGAPKVKFSMGRPQPKAPSPPGLVPSPGDNVTTILARMGSVGFSPQELVALLASHSIGDASLDATRPRTAFDSTPAIMDTQFYTEVLCNGTLFPGTAHNFGEVKSAINGTLRLGSDSLIARDPRTACFWQDLVDDHHSMKTQFADALFKLSLLGQNQNKLTDCSSVIPSPPHFHDVPHFPPGLSIKDINQSCNRKFPNLPTQHGQPLDVPPVPPA